VKYIAEAGIKYIGRSRY